MTDLTIHRADKGKYIIINKYNDQYMVLNYHFMRWQVFNEKGKSIGIFTSFKRCKEYINKLKRG